jgi:formamidopyrimidine-DNA glycosylase
MPQVEPMPELPDLAILADALHAGLVGRPVVATDVAQPLVMRATSAELGALEGQVLRSVRRRGKFLLFGLDWTGSSSIRC